MELSSQGFLRTGIKSDICQVVEHGSHTCFNKHTVTQHKMSETVVNILIISLITIAIVNFVELDKLHH